MFEAYCIIGLASVVIAVCMAGNLFRSQQDKKRATRKYYGRYTKC